MDEMKHNGGEVFLEDGMNILNAWMVILLLESHFFSLVMV